MRKKILVIIAHRGIGDLIYHLPLLRSLKESSNTQITVLSNKVNRAVQVYENENFYDEIIEFDNSRMSFPKNIYSILYFKNLINKISPEEIILTSNSKRLTIPVFLSRAKKKTIFGSRFLSTFNSSKIKNMTSSEKIIYFSESLSLPKFKLNFNLKINENVEEVKNKVFISVDSHHNQNDWNLKNYIKLIEKLILKEFYVYLNFREDKDIKNLLPSHFYNSEKINFTFKNNISELIKIISNCKYVVGNESGPVCIGASLNKKVFSIYLPIHTKPESKVINKNTKYYKVGEFDDDFIIEEILRNVEQDL